MALAHAAGQRSNCDARHREVHALGEALAMAEQPAQDGAREEPRTQQQAERIAAELHGAEQAICAAERSEVECERELAADDLEAGRLRTLIDEAKDLRAASVGIAGTIYASGKP